MEKETVRGFLPTIKTTDAERKAALSGSRILNMDCLKGLREMEEGRIDVVVTSPPYNIGTAYKTYRDDIKREDYLDWIEDVGSEIRRVMKDDGSFFLNVGSKATDPWVPWEVAFRMKKFFKLQNVIIWVKNISIFKADVGDYGKVTDDISVGHFKPLNSPKYLSRNHEYIFHFTKHGDVKLDKLSIGTRYQDKSNISRFHRELDLRDRGDVWYIPYKTIRSRQKDRPHPAAFPPRLPEMCIKVHGLERTKMVLDPFMGIGNTAIASISLGIRCIGFEVDRYYYDYTKGTLERMFS